MEPSSTGSLDGTAGAATVDSENETEESAAELTLITGDTVVIDDQGDETDYRLKGNTSAAIYETRTGAYVIPAHVNTTRFSKELFNVELLRGQNQTDAETDEIPLIVEWANASSMRTGVRSRSRVDVTRKRLLEMMNGSAVSVSKENASAVYRFLAGSDAVKSVHYNAQYQGMAIDPRGNVNARLARQSFDVTGDGVTVAVLDSGVNESHPDLRDSEIGEVNFVEYGPARDVLNHGTPIAGIIAGDGTAGNGSYVGIAPEANILDVRVLGSANNAMEDTIVEGMDYAIQQDVDIISMSLGKTASNTRRSDPFYRQIRRAAENNVTVVTTTGNKGNAAGTQVMTPGIHREVITVGSSVNASRVAYGSRHGPTPDGQFVKPDLVAPGVEVSGPSARSDGYYEDTGTSFATPFVSGATALLQERHPNWDERRVKNVLTSTADPLGPQDVYSQGGGTLDVSGALDPGLVVDPATIDFGQVTMNSTYSETVTVRNLAAEPRSGDVSVQAVPIESSGSGTVSVNRSSVTLAPGETARLRLTIDTSNAVTEPYSGRLQVGDANAIFGYVPKRMVTIRKEGIGSISGDSVSLVHRQTERDYGPREFTNGTVLFEVADAGEYVAISEGSHDGQPIVTVNSTTVRGRATMELDESDTVGQSIDTGSLPQSGSELHNRTLVVNVTLDGINYDDRIVVDNPRSGAFRVSPSSDATYAIRRILTVSPTERRYNTSTIYHLHHVVESPSESTVVAVDVEQLQRQYVRYYRGTPNETYRATLGTKYFDDVPVSESYEAAGIGTRFNQTIYVSPSLTQYHDSYVWSSGGLQWAASPQWTNGLVEFDGSNAVTTAVKKGPFRSVVDEWTLTDQEFQADVFPTVGQPPNGYVVKDRPAESYDLWINGEHNESFSRDGVLFSTPPVQGDIDSVKFRVDDRHGMSPLSNDTVTTFAATTNGSDTRPPSVPGITFEPHGKTNVIPNGSVDVSVSATDGDGSVRNISLYVATRDSEGSPTETPFTNASGWRHVSLNETGDGTYEMTLDLGDYHGTLSIALRAVDDAGNYVETTARDGLVVGSRTPTAQVTANRTLVETDEAVRLDASESFDDLAVSEYAWDLDGDGSVDERTTEPTTTHRYAETGTVTPTVTVRDPHGFENSTSLPVTVASSLPPRTEELDNQTTKDVRRAAESDQIRVASARLNGKQDLDSDEMLVARGDVNGGFDGDDGSTIVIDGGRVNGETEGHNVIGADARFNGGIDASGTVTVATGTVNVNSGIEAAESVSVLGNSTLTVSGELEAETVHVGKHASLLVRGDAAVERLHAENESTVQVRGHVECAESRVGAGVTVDVRGHSECGASETATGSMPNQTATENTVKPNESDAKRSDAPTATPQNTPAQENVTGSTDGAIETVQQTETNQTSNTTETAQDPSSIESNSSSADETSPSNRSVDPATPSTNSSVPPGTVQNGSAGPAGDDVGETTETASEDRVNDETGVSKPGSENLTETPANTKIDQGTRRLR